MASHKNMQDIALTELGSRTHSVPVNTREARNPVSNRPAASVIRMSIAEDAPATLSFHGINYIIGAQAETNNRFLKCPTIPFLKPPELKHVLENLSGQFTNGLNAILGKISSKFLHEI